MWVFSSCSEQRMLECGVRASRCSGFSCSLHLGPKMHGLQSLQSICSVALRHVRSFWTRGHTCVPCIGRWILNYRTTREILFLFFFFFFFLRKKRGNHFLVGNVQGIHSSFLLGYGGNSGAEFSVFTP